MVNKFDEKEKQKSCGTSRVQSDRDSAGERQLPPKEAAVVIAMSESWLAKARVTGVGPPYSKVGRSIRYSPTALARWLKSREHSSTSEYLKPRNRQVDESSTASMARRTIQHSEEDDKDGGDRWSRGTTR